MRDYHACATSIIGQWKQPGKRPASVRSPVVTLRSAGGNPPIGHGASGTAAGQAGCLPLQDSVEDLTAYIPNQKLRGPLPIVGDGRAPCIKRKVPLNYWLANYPYDMLVVIIPPQVLGQRMLFIGFCPVLQVSCSHCWIWQTPAA